MLPAKEKHAVRKRQAKGLMEAAIDDFHDYRVDRHSFTIFVGGDPDLEDYDVTGVEPGVEHRMADRFDINLSILSGIDPKRPILVQMASCGGLWEEGMQMFGALLTAPNPITVLGTKWCRSMSSIIPLAADRFYMRMPAKYMYHHGYFEFEGLDQEAMTADVERRKSREVMMRLYTARLQEQGQFLGQTESFIRKHLKRRLLEEIDVWFDADEAVIWGFVDGVFEGNHERLRVGKRNLARRERMLAVLRRKVKVEVHVS